jgi:paraquat-inducible protein B
MIDAPNLPREPGDPAVRRRRMLPSLVWLVPIVAALIGLSMLVNAWLSEGPKITIAFKTAAGLEAGKTPIKYKDVVVGAVTAIALSEDGTHVEVTAELARSASSLTREDTRFWVVRPRIGIGGVSGVDTLLSGAYIAADAGSSEETSRTFTGLETPPTVISGMPGKTIVLHTADLGSLDIGSPVYYRRIQVGRVASYELDESGKSVNIQAFIDAPYDRFVTTRTWFWNASGVDVSLGAEGFNLKTQSLATILSGGIAFDSPPYNPGEVAPENAEFTLAPDQKTAMAPPDGPGQYLQLRFAQSLRGLAVGAPVLFSGVELGRVVSVGLDYDPTTKRFPTVVGIVIYPQRLGRAFDKLPKAEGGSPEHAQLLQTMVGQGLRAQARTGNLQLYVSLDFVPRAPKVAFDATARPLQVPTVSGDFDQLQEQVSSIVRKIDKLPLESIAKNLDAAIANLDKTLQQINGEVLPQTTQTLQQAQKTLDGAQGMLGSVLADDAPLQQNLNQTLQDTRRTMRSVRTLTDLLGRHPDALLRGLPANAVPDEPAPADLSEDPVR